MSALARPSLLKPEKRLEHAVLQFKASLSIEEKAAFEAHEQQSRNSPPDVSDVMRVTAEIDGRVAGKAGPGRCFGPRLVNILQAVQQFAALGDIVLGGSQNLIACSVWSLVRMTLLSLVNFTSYFSKLSELFMDVGRSAPRYQSMALLYPQSRNLQSHLSEYFLVVVRLCHELLHSTRASILAQFITGTDVKKCRSDLDLWASSIKQEVDLLTAQEIKKQSSQITALFKSSQSESHRKNVKTRLHVLNACSTYDHESMWKQIRKSGNTTLFTQAREYQDWKGGSKASTLVYTGKLGSGKSVSLANMVDDLCAQNSRSPVAYFFCRHDISESLTARTILGSLARQLLCTIQQPLAIFEGLVDPDCRALDPEGILRLLERVIPSSYKAHFILDGLDECNENQKMGLILQLSKLQRHFSLFICLSFRLEVDNASMMNVGEFTDPSIISIPEDNPDIADFIQTELERRVESGMLRLGDPTLILEIQGTLLERAQGMFLWVVLQIESLCFAKTDEAIREALANLPKGLPDTFSRILQQSEALGKHDQRRTLELITAACRLLTTNELQEALAVVPGDTNWNPARMPNDIYSVLACCGCLVAVDEEALTVQLIHPSVKQFLLSGPGRLSGQTFTISSANKAMSGVVATYLNYNVFETQLSPVAVPQLPAGAIPTTIIRSTLGSATSVQKIALRLLRASGKVTDIGEILARERGIFMSQSPLQFFFLAYAKSFWLQHIQDVVHPEPTICRLWIRFLERSVIDKHIGNENSRTLLLWAAKGGHEVVARLLLDAGAAVDTKDVHIGWALEYAAGNGHEDVVQLFVDRGADVKGEDGQSALAYAASNGHEAVVRLLLDRGAAINAKDNDGVTALVYAAAKGHEAVVSLLLDRGAAFDMEDKDGHTALEYAADKGHAAVVRLLLDKGAAVAGKDKYSLIALVQAAGLGHKAIVQLLIDGGAAVDEKDEDGRTALLYAAGEGREAVVQLLLDMGAAIDAKDRDGQTALAHAADKGRGAVVQLLLDRGMDVDVKNKDDETALVYAANRGHEAVVQLLLDRGAFVDAKNKYGEMALGHAAGNGHEAVVRLLLDRGATINAKDNDGGTALSFAVAQRHEAVVRLLRARLAAAAKDKREKMLQGDLVVARNYVDQQGQN